MIIKQDDQGEGGVVLSDNNANHSTMTTHRQSRYRDLVPPQVVVAFPEEKPIYCDVTTPLPEAPSTFILTSVSNAPEVARGTKVSFLWDCIKQIRLFNPKAHIVLLMDQKKPWTLSVNATEEFGAIICSTPHPTLAKTIAQDRRFHAIGPLMKKLDLRDAWHMESDNMVYADFTDYTQTASRLFEEVATTPLGTINEVGYQMTGGFMFFKDSLAAETLSLYSWDRIMQRDNRGFGAWNNDMRDMGTIQQRLGTRFLANLPILPYGKFSRYAKSFNMSIFDAAGYGQYLDGVGRAAPPGQHTKKGWTGAHHFIGDGFIHGMFNLSWKQDEEKRWYPVVYDTTSKKSYRLNNLHIYTKHLSEFRSDQAAMPDFPSLNAENIEKKSGTVRDWHIQEVWPE